ncbi:MAG: hypothetical protein ACP5IJ_00570 [Candidatus Nanoarchaeia archaeon]
MANEEEIGFHKGALMTLLKEREEFVRLIGVVDALIKAHAEALKKYGVDVTKTQEKTKEKTKK